MDFRKDFFQLAWNIAKRYKKAYIKQVVLHKSHQECNMGKTRESSSEIWRVLFITGLVLFLFFSFLGILCRVTYRLVLVSYEYNQRAMPLALIVSIYIGASFILPFFDAKVAKKLKKDFKYSNSITSKITLLSLSVFISWLMYIQVVTITATYFHQNAPKEYVEIKTTVDSVWASRRIARDCLESTVFRYPDLSPFPQSVCLTYIETQTYLPNVRNPVEVKFYGGKSFYGYELKCCKP